MNLDLLIDKKIVNYQYQQLIDEWLLESEISDNTKLTYMQGLEKYITFLNKNKFISNRESMIRFKNELIKDFSNSTAYIYISGVKSFYKYLKRKYNLINVSVDIKLPKIAQGFKRDCLTVEQVCNLLNSLEDNTLTKARDKAIINLFIRCGLRCCELINCNIEDIGTKDGLKVLYVKGKGHEEKDDFVVLTNDMLEIIDKYLNLRKNYIDKSPLFISHSNRSYGKKLDSSTIRYICKNYLRKINIDSPRVSCHSFRHTAITLSILAGANLVDVKDFARHNNINTSLRYIHNLKRLENAPELKIAEFLKKNVKKDEI